MGAIDPEDLKRSFVRLARRGVEIGARVNRGQGDSPIGEHIEAILEDLESGPYHLVLVGLEPSSRSAALAALCGHDPHVLSLSMPEEFGLYELRLGDRGYTLQAADGKRREFDQLESFAQALTSASLLMDGDAHDLLEPLRMGMSAPKEVRGLCVLMPEKLEAIGKSHRMASRLQARSSLLCVAGSVDSDPSEDHRAMLVELASGFDVVAPLVVCEQSEAGDDSKANLPRRGWWTDRRLLAGEHLLPPRRLNEAQEANEFFSSSHPLRKVIFLSRQASRLASAASMIKQEIGEDLSQLKGRRKQLDRELRASDEASRSADLRREFDLARTAILDDLRELANGVQEFGRKALLPGSALLQIAEDQAATLAQDDVDKELSAPSGRIRMSVKDEVSERLCRELYGGLSRELEANLVFVRDGLGLIERSGAKSLSVAKGASQTLHIPLPDERQVRNRIRELLALRLDCRGEIEKRSFLKRLGKGRQMVFTVMMSVSLFGGLFGVGRDNVLAASILLPLFVGAFLYTYISWSKEDRSRVEKEVESLQDQVRQKLERLAAEGVREVQDRLRKSFDESRELIQRTVDASLRDTGESASKDADRRQKELRSRITTQDRRVQDLAGLDQQVSEFDQESRELVRQCAQELRAIVRSSNDEEAGRASGNRGSIGGSKGQS